MFRVDLEPGLAKALGPLELLAFAVLDGASQLKERSGLFQVLDGQGLVHNLQGLVLFVGLKTGVAGQSPHDGVLLCVLANGEEALNGPVFTALAKIDGSQHSLGLPGALEASLQQGAGGLKVALHVLNGAKL